MSGNPSPIGVLGLGFLGQTLLREHTFTPDSWGTWRGHQVAGLTFAQHCFDWENPESFQQLPNDATVLLLTIPPVEKNPENEALRLRAWGVWMQQNRPQQQRLIYISTTSVYPRQPGLWNEDMPLRPDSPSGQLRLQTEQVLCEFFKVQVVRPGGIYGPGRNLVERLKAGKGIPETPKLTHRIHVCDLAGIVAWLVQHPEGPGCVNAVDQEARSSWEVAEWLVQHHPELNPEMLPEQSKSVLPENAPERRIDNQRLLREMDYKLRFPTFREGMRPH